MQPNKSRIVEVIKQLKVLSALEENDKLCTNSSDIYIDRANSWLQSLRRWVSYENRQQNVTKIQEIFSESFDVAEELLNQRAVIDSKSSKTGELLILENTQQITRLIEEIEKAIKSIGNLRLTYSNDATITSFISSIIDVSNDRLERVKLHFNNQACKQKIKF